MWANVEKQQKTIRSAEPQPSTSGYRKRPKDNQNKDAKTKKRVKSKKNSDNTPCLYCSEVYSQSKAGEGWVKCGECDAWAHQECAGYERGAFICDFCD